MAIYFFLSSASISHAICKKIFNVSSLIVDLRIKGIFSSLERNIAVEVDSIISINNLSILSPKEYREVFGKRTRNFCQSLYDSISFRITGKFALGGGIIGLFCMKRLGIHFDEIFSVDNLLCAFAEFLKGKRGKKDVCEFSLHLMDNILELHRELATKTYIHCLQEK